MVTICQSIELREFERTNFLNVTMPVLLQEGFRFKLPKFSEFILYTNQNKFSSYVCSTRICSGIARGFYGQNPPENFNFLFIN